MAASEQDPDTNLSEAPVCANGTSASQPPSLDAIEFGVANTRVSVIKSPFYSSSKTEVGASPLVIPQSSVIATPSFSLGDYATVVVQSTVISSDVPATTDIAATAIPEAEAPKEPPKPSSSKLKLNASAAAFIPSFLVSPAVLEGPYDDVDEEQVFEENDSNDYLDDGDDSPEGYYYPYYPSGQGMQYYNDTYGIPADSFGAASDGIMAYDYRDVDDATNSYLDLAGYSPDRQRPKRAPILRGNRKILDRMSAQTLIYRDGLHYEQDLVVPQKRLSYRQDYLRQFRSHFTEKPLNLPDLQIVIGHAGCSGDGPVGPVGMGKPPSGATPSPTVTPSTNVKVANHSAPATPNCGRKSPASGKKGGKHMSTPSPYKSHMTQGDHGGMDDDSFELLKANNPWRIGVLSQVAATDEILKTQRRVRGILNKLAPERFDRLVEQFFEIEVTSADILRCIIATIFEKAVDEATFSSMYAELCLRLSKKMPEFVDPVSGQKQNFRRMLLSKCYYETFINDFAEKPVPIQEPAVRSRSSSRSEAAGLLSAADAVAAALLIEKDVQTDQLDKLSNIARHSARDNSINIDEAPPSSTPAIVDTTSLVVLDLSSVPPSLVAPSKPRDALTVEELAERGLREKKRLMGNIVLIGHLYIKNLITEEILHMCMTALVDDDEQPQDDEVEAACVLLQTVGPLLDTWDGGRDKVDEYFGRLDHFSCMKGMASRIRFMCKDMLELRNNAWVPRREKVVDPKKIAEVRAQAEKELAESEANTPLQTPTKSKGILRSASKREGSSRSATPNNTPKVSVAELLAKERGVPLKTTEAAPVAAWRPKSLQSRPSTVIDTDGWATVPGASPSKTSPPTSKGRGRGRGADRGSRGRGDRPTAVGRGRGRGVSPSPSKSRLAAPISVSRGGSRLAALPSLSPFVKPPTGSTGVVTKKTASVGGSFALLGRDSDSEEVTEEEELPFGEEEDDTYDDLCDDELSQVSSLMDSEKPAFIIYTDPLASPSLVSGCMAEDMVDGNLPPPSPRMKLFDSERLKDRCRLFLSEYFQCHDITEAALCFDELASPDAFNPKFVKLAMTIAMDERDQQRELVSRLFERLKAKGRLTAMHFEDGFRRLEKSMPDLLMDIPFAKKYFMEFLKNCKDSGCVAESFETGPGFE